MEKLETRVPPPILMLLFAGAVWAVGRLAPDPAWPAALQSALALGLFGLAGVFGFPAVAAFRGARTTINPVRVEEASVLVTQGVFAVSRNPMYVALTLLLAAWSVFLGPVWGSALVPLFVLWIDRLQIRPEERVLTEKFGADYAAYRGRVRRWL